VALEPCFRGGCRCYEDFLVFGGRGSVLGGNDQMLLHGGGSKGSDDDLGRIEDHSCVGQGVYRYV
jgi:hypothetical protein